MLVCMVNDEWIGFWSLDASFLHIYYRNTNKYPFSFISSTTYIENSNTQRHGNMMIYTMFSYNYGGIIQTTWINQEHNVFSNNSCNSPLLYASVIWDGYSLWILYSWEKILIKMPSICNIYKVVSSE